MGRSSFSRVTARDKTNLVQRLVGLLSPDNYTLTISQPKITAEPFAPRAGRCYPYIWELQLVPRGLPFVSFVFPEGGEGFNPYSDLVLRITFSDPPYNRTSALPATRYCTLCFFSFSFFLTFV